MANNYWPSLSEALMADYLRSGEVTEAKTLPGRLTVNIRLTPFMKNK
jgi:hypothetical protein